jgi:hypothetical protein
MQLKRSPETWHVVLIALLIVALLPGLLAAKKYKAKDLKGTYHYVVTEARAEAGPPNIQYCDSYGTIVFDGVGKAYTTIERRRCTWVPAGGPIEVSTELGVFDYFVYSDGQFLMTELDTDFHPPVPTSYVTHGRIVQGGKLLLVDGTRGCVDPPAVCPHPEFLMTIAVAAKE